MAGYSPEVIRDFAERFGPKDPIAKAEEKALEVPGFGEEIRRVDTELGWLSQSLHPPAAKREELEEERRRLVVEALTESAPSEQPASTSKRGRQKGQVSIYEANLAAGIYVRDRADYDARDDGGAYAVHKLYSEDRDPGPTLLSRPMIGHLLVAIRAGLVPWDARTGRLRISDEFRTSKSTFVIPRS
jgi:hypothetical protein